MISEYRAEIDELFGDLVPTFSEPDQLNELIHYWLDPARDSRRAEMSEALAQVVKPHSYTERAKTILRMLETSWQAGVKEIEDCNSFFRDAMGNEFVRINGDVFRL